MFWLMAFALQNFLTVTTLGGFTGVCRENCDLLVFGGVWALGEILGKKTDQKTDKKNLTRKKLKKKLKILAFVAVSKDVFPSKTERFFFAFGPWCPL